MIEHGAARQTARIAALAGLFLVTLAPLIVANSFFFPFITGKAFFFRIVVEIAVAGWIVLALVDREYRSRFSWIGAVVLGFVAWMFVANAFAPNAVKAFWSNFERMEGWVLLVHLLGFFAAASAVLRVERKWRAWFLTSLAVSLIVSAYALLQLIGVFAIHQGSTRIDATLGNSAYLAIYFFFNVFIALWLAFSERRAWLKWSLIALGAVEAVLIFFTETRGTVLALVLALALAAFLTALAIGKNARRVAALALAFIIVLTAGFYLARNSAFIRNDHVLQRIASISLSDGQTRFTLWHMAFAGMLERPITGWGQEGFNYVFNKQYDPSLYMQEPWFDRAHNAFIDWLSAGGLPAFVLYLLLFCSAIVLLSRTALARAEKIILTAALAGYAVHNFFVFDNLYSYVYFFAILACIDSSAGRPIEQLERLPELSAASAATSALPIAGATALVLIWFVNVPGMQAASGLITAISSSPNVSRNIAAFENLAAHLSFAMQEVREQMVQFAGVVAQDQSATREEKQRMTSLAVAEMQKQVAAYPLDAREHLQLSYAYRAAGDAAGALKETNVAIALSPKKEEFYVEKGVFEWDLGDEKAARADFNAAYALGPQFPDLATYAAAGDIAAGDQAGADAVLRAALGTADVDSDILAAAYYRAKNWPRLVGMLRMRAGKPGAGAQAWFSLAAAEYQSGDAAAAVATLNAAVARYPDAATSAAAAITQIQRRVK